MTKFALEALADALRPEVKPFGIEATQVLPGPFASAYLEKLIASIPDTSSGSPYLDFKRGIISYMSKFLRPDGLGVMTSERVARTVVKAGTVTRPKSRYRVGLISKFGPMGRTFTPDSLVDAVTSRKLLYQPAPVGCPRWLPLRMSRAPAVWDSLVYEETSWVASRAFEFASAEAGFFNGLVSDEWRRQVRTQQRLYLGSGCVAL
jgi:hypothetical protein